MAKKQTKKAPRKRRSFFEPESKVLTDWLAQQNDLGVSLQLIIVDAIRNYGDGDVIQAFLTAREKVQGEPPVTSSLPAPKAAEVAPTPVKQTAPVVKAAPVAPQPEDDWELPEEVAAEPVAPKAKAEPVQKAAPVAQEPDDLPAGGNPDEEVNPLDIMFADAGSQLRS